MTAEQEIRVEIYRALELLKADPHLLAAIGSWGDTLSDDEVLKLSRQWNEPENAHDPRWKVAIAKEKFDAVKKTEEVGCPKVGCHREGGRGRLSPHKAVPSQCGALSHRQRASLQGRFDCAGRPFGPPCFAQHDKIAPLSCCLRRTGRCDVPRFPWFLQFAHANGRERTKESMTGSPSL